MKLWQKHPAEETSDLQSLVERFTVGSDATWDLRLAAADVKGSLAHAEMLHGIGLLSDFEWSQLQKGLNLIAASIAHGSFVIEDGVEDVHSQIELLLTRSYGDAGKKIHGGRSRNDQSLLDIKLYIKDEIETIAAKAELLFEELIGLSDRYQDALMPGYTHMQLAMPSSFGLWFGAYAESLTDDLELLLAAYHVANKNPLGSAAGYGSSFPIDRTLTTQLLGMEALNYNVVYAQMTRGKTEKIMAMAMASLAASLSRFSADACLYMNQNFGFISFPDALTTGSSIMPHKKNPDVFELIRAKCNRIQALPNELTLLSANLPSGYHRDMQLTKECLFPAITELKNCLDMLLVMLRHCIINTNILDSKTYDNLFTVETVNRLVLDGMPFRDAYREVARQVGAGEFVADRNLHHVHEGSIGNLCNEQIRRAFQKKRAQIPYSSSGK